MTSSPELSATVITRFAPSPTGALHLGHAASAIRAHDFARARGGRFLLRIEDIDPGRMREAHVEGILRDLAWLGLAWDGAVVRQSERLGFYADALARLKNGGLVYPCFCTRRDITESAAAPHEATPLYPGTCRRLGAAERETRIAAGVPHCWRLDVGKAEAVAGSLSWQDGGAGPVPADARSQGDVVLARKDAPVSYHLAVTVDDAAQGVTDIVRGEDLFAATHVHRLLQALLDLPTPAYHHHPLVTDTSGKRLAKRHGALRLAELRDSGTDGVALAAAVREGLIGFGKLPASA